MESTRTLEFYYEIIYARQIMSIMASVIKRKCVGCTNGYLSQRNHSCLNLTIHDQLNINFKDIVREVNECDILKTWSDAVSAMNVSTLLVDRCKETLTDHQHRHTDTWKKRLINMTIRLYQLEHRFV